MSVAITHRIESLLWHPRLAEAPMLARTGVALARILYAVLRDVATGPLTLRAMGLVYVTILSIVPLLAVSFSVLKAFGFHRQLQPLLHRLLEPLGQRGAELADQVIGFVDNAQGDVLAGLGLLFLLFTAVTMAEQVEAGLNQIWRVDRPRSLGRRVSEYLSVILAGPVVMVAAMTLIGTLRSAAQVGRLSAFEESASMAEELVPYLLVCAGFSLVYWFVPNTSVRVAAALTGGLVGGVLWAGSGALFAAFVVNSTMTLSIYATFAVVITALFWLYLCWLILLVGAQVAFYTQHPDYLRTGYRAPVTGTGQLEQAALAVMLIVGEAFRGGGSAAKLADISRVTTLPALALIPVIARLTEAGLLTQTADDELLPQRDPARIRLTEIVNAVRHPAVPQAGPRVRWPEQLTALSSRLEAGIAGALREETLAETLEHSGSAEKRRQDRG
jgi:membrane protein